MCVFREIEGVRNQLSQFIYKNKSRDDSWFLLRAGVRGSLVEEFVIKKGTKCVRVEAASGFVFSKCLLSSD